MNEEAKDKLKSIVGKVAKLGWVQLSPDGEPIMHLADVEKTILALLDESDMSRIDVWVEEAEKSGNTISKLKEMPSYKIKNLELITKNVGQNGKWFGEIVRGKACIMKVCPFFKKEVPINNRDD